MKHLTISCLILGCLISIILIIRSIMFEFNIWAFIPACFWVIMSISLYSFLTSEDKFRK